MKPKVVIPARIRKDALAYIQEHCEVQQWTETTPIPRETLKEWLVDADGYWSIGSIPCDADLIAGCQQLKVIAQASVGYDNVNIAYLTAKQIPYGNTPDVLTETTAELAFTLVAAASRRIYENMKYVSDNRWMERPSPIRGRDLSRRTLGIIGMGKIGISISRRARAFGMSVVYNNRNPRKDDRLFMTSYMPLDDLLALSDVVLVAAPLTEETKGMCDEAFFAKMKPDALFVNIGRGKIVDTDALVQALNNGVIDYAALDVTDPEPMPADHLLLQTGKVLITPHIGSYTDRCRRDMAFLTADNLIRGMQKQALKTCVNPEVNYKG